MEIAIIINVMLVLLIIAGEACKSYSINTQERKEYKEWLRKNRVKEK